jgi:hypothetical protein
MLNYQRVTSIPECFQVDIQKSGTELGTIGRKHIAAIMSKFVWPIGPEILDDF